MKAGKSIVRLVIHGEVTLRLMALVLVCAFLQAGGAWAQQKSGATCKDGSHPVCEPGKVLESGLCYTKCGANYQGDGPVCRQDCPSGYVAAGTLCRIDKPLTVSCNWHCDKVGKMCINPKCNCPSGYKGTGFTGVDYEGHCALELPTPSFGHPAEGLTVPRYAYPRAAGTVPAWCPSRS